MTISGREKGDASVLLAPLVVDGLLGGDGD
jgi:hypothetical protein